MGMPLSYYPLFWALEDPQHPGYRKAKEALSPFRLFCLVLLDLDRDRPLAEFLAKRWNRLDEETGRHLLFFAPVDPPSTWFEREDVKTRGHHRLISEPGDPLSRKYGLSIPNTPNPSQTMHDIGQSLGLKPLGMPVLAISTDLSGKEGWILETGEVSLRDQLAELGRLANDLQDEESHVSEIEEQLASLACRSNSRIFRFSAGIKSIGSSLMQVSAYGSSTRNEMIEGKRVQEHFALLQRSIAGELKKWNRHLEDDPDNEIALRALSTWLDLAFRGLLTESTLHLPGRNKIFPDWTPDSRRSIETGDRILSFFSESDMTDFRGAAIYYCTALEGELAGCIGHEIRGQLGVSLPKYYNRFQEGLSRVCVRVENGKREIPFNQKDRKSLDGAPACWQPPGLGDLRLAGEVSDISLSAKEDMTWNKLNSLLIEANKIRKKTAHPKEPVTRGECEKFRKFLSEIDALPAWRTAIARRPELGGWGPKKKIS